MRGIGAAAADDIPERCVDVRIGRLRPGLEQCACGHDLRALAVAALDHIEVEPRGAYGLGLLAVHALDGRDLHGRAQRRHRQLACQFGLAIHMQRAGAADAHAAAELRSGQREIATQDPEQRHVGFRVHADRLAVHVQGRHCFISVARQASAATLAAAGRSARTGHWPPPARSAACTLRQCPEAARHSQ